MAAAVGRTGPRQRMAGSSSRGSTRSRPATGAWEGSLVVGGEGET